MVGKWTIVYNSIVPEVERVVVVVASNRADLACNDTKRVVHLSLIVEKWINRARREREREMFLPFHVDDT